jgi:hypothetical protein
MPAQIFGAEASVVQLYIAYFGVAPSNPIYENFIDTIEGSSAQALSTAIAAQFASLTDAQFAAKILANLGINSTTVNATALAALQSGFAAYLTAVTPASRGVVVMQLINILTTLEGNATYGAAATAFNDATFASFTYASNPGNLVPATSSTPSANFVLTAGVDTIVGTAASDTVSGTDTTFTGLDNVNGGGGIDNLIINDVAGGMNTLNVGAIVAAIENLLFNSTGSLTIDTQTNFSGVTNITANVGAGSDLTIQTKANATTVTASAVSGTLDDVTITDNGTLATDKLATVSLNMLDDDAAVSSDALVNLTVTNATANGHVTVTNNTVGHTLNLTVGGNAAGSMVADAAATTLNVTTTSTSSSTITAGAATKVTFAGAGASTAAQDFAASAVIDASTSTGGVTLTNSLEIAQQFTGGSGKDSVIVAAGNTKAIAMMGGDDTVTMSAAVGTGGSVDGGDGTDTLSMAAADAAAVSVTSAFEAGIGNFEKLKLGAATGAVVINLANIDDISYVITAGAGGGDTV